MAVKFLKSDIKNAIKGSGGIISTIAKRLKCDWHTAKKHIEKYEDTKIMLSDEEEATLDMTEGMLMKNILAGAEASIFFMLKTKGKKRGYVEKQEIDMTTQGEKINNVDYSQLNEATLEDLAKNVNFEEDENENKG